MAYKTHLIVKSVHSSIGSDKEKVDIGVLIEPRIQVVTDRHDIYVNKPNRYIFIIHVGVNPDTGAPLQKISLDENT